MKFFALVVDGEVAKIIDFPNTDNFPAQMRDHFEELIAIMKSNPTVIEVDSNLVKKGYLWDGKDFIGPTEE